VKKNVRNKEEKVTTAPNGDPPNGPSFQVDLQAQVKSGSMDKDSSGEKREKEKYRRKRVSSADFTSLQHKTDGDFTSLQQQVTMMMDNHFSALYAAQDEMAANMKTLMSANAHIVNQLTEITARDSTSAKPAEIGRLGLKRVKEKVRKKPTDEQA